MTPYAFGRYLPAPLLLDRDTPWRWLGLATPLVTPLVVAVTGRLWRHQGVGH